MMASPAGTRVPARGFTLLEVMVSLSILALSLTAIAGINANSFNASNYAKYVTVATLLARSKMLDIEEQLRKDGFGDDDKEYSGDFDEEGYSGIEWVATCRRVEVDVNQLLGGLFGGEVSSESMPEQIQTYLGALRGEGDEGLAAQVGGSDLAKMLGGEQLGIIFKQVGDTLGKSIREITLEITWGKKEKNEETVRFVQYVTTTGRLSLPSSTLGLPPGLRPGDRNPDTLAVPPLGGPPPPPPDKTKGAKP